MKKVFTLVAVASLSLVACGPSAEEVAAKAKAVADSIAAYETEQAAIVAAEAQKVADSTAAYAAAAEAEAKRIADSIEAASKKGAKPTKPKTIEQKKKEEAVKATGGRG